MKSVTKKSCLVLVCVCVIFSFSYLQKRKNRTDEKMATIRVCQVVEHEALDAVVQGLKEVITQDSPAKLLLKIAKEMELWLLRFLKSSPIYQRMSA